MTKTRGQKADRGHSQSQRGGDGEEPGLGRGWGGGRAIPRKLARGRGQGPGGANPGRVLTGKAVFRRGAGSDRGWNLSLASQHQLGAPGGGCKGDGGCARPPRQPNILPKLLNEFIVTQLAVASLVNLRQACFLLSPHLSG